MKIGVLTYHKSHNYGAYLQSFALVNFIKENTRHEVEIINYNTTYSEIYYIKELFKEKSIKSFSEHLKRYIMFKKEVKKLPLSKFKLTSNNYNKLINIIKNKYDLIIVGSDEIWKIPNLRKFPNAYWLPNIKNVIKVSYAASARCDYKLLTKREINYVNYYLSDFKYISVRDNVTKEFINNVNNKYKVDVVCDPTIAFNFKKCKEEGYKILKEKFGINNNKKCIGIMLNNRKLANYIINNKKDEYEIISLYHFYNNAKNYSKLTPFEWYKVISSLDGFITNYFHGMCFALNFDIPFRIIEERYISDNKYSKSYDLLERNGLEEYYLRNTCDNFEKIKLEIDNFINNIINNNEKTNYKEIREHEKETANNFIDMLNKM